MSSIRAIALIFGLLAAATLLIPAATARAHEGVSAVAPAPAAESPPVQDSAAPVVAIPGRSASTPAPEPSALTSWIVAGALALGGLALRRGPRRAVVVGLVLLLALFAFEDALHSVHHGFDPKQAETCTIAAASGHVSGVAVEAVVGASMILMPVGQAVEPDRSPLPLHRLASDQGRAPPALAA